MAFEYRRLLQTVITTAGDYLPTPEHTAIVERVLNSIPVPTMPKYPGEVTEQDKAWYRTCLKVDYTAILQEYINKLQ